MYTAEDMMVTYLSMISREVHSKTNSPFPSFSVWIGGSNLFLPTADVLMEHMEYAKLSSYTVCGVSDKE